MSVDELSQGGYFHFKPFGLGFVDQSFDLSSDLVADPVSSALGADRCRDMPYYHNPKAKLRGKGGLAGLLTTAA
jgi:hypothetical protein